MKTLLNVLIFFIGISGSYGQEKSSVHLQSIDGLINELLNQITIKPGEKMDTSAVRQLFYPRALLTIRNPGDSTFAESVSLDEFLELLMDPYYEAGYEERAIARKIDEYNGIAQVFQSFYGKDSEGTEERGINSYQLAHFNNRWWIVSMLWTLETDEAPIPKAYLKN